MTESAVFPLSTAHLPGDVVSLRVFEDRYLRMLTDLEELGGSFVSVLISRGTEVGGGDTRFAHGVSISVEDVSPGPAWVHVLGRAECAVTAVRWLDDDPYPRAMVDVQTEIETDTDTRYDIAATTTLLAQRVRSLVASLPETESAPWNGRKLATIAAGRWWNARVVDADLWRAFWIVAGSVPCGPLDRHQFLEPGPLSERLSRLRLTIEHVSDIMNFRFGQ